MLVLFALTFWPNTLPMNFSAAYALAFCAGAYSRRLPWWAVFGTFFVTDMALNVFYYSIDAISPFMIVKYLALGAIFWVGKLLTSKASSLKLIFGGIFGALLFYIITNTGSWFANPEYAKNFMGWIQALTIGTPSWPHTWEFFRNTLLSGGLFTALFVSVMKHSEAKEPEPEEEKETQEAEEPKPEEAKS